MFKTRRWSQSRTDKTKKLTQFKLKAEEEDTKLPKDGEFSTLTN
jgi:hypothetical protein